MLKNNGDALPFEEFRRLKNVAGRALYVGVNILMQFYPDFAI